MKESLRAVMVVSYYLGLALTVAAAGLKVAAIAGIGPGFQATNWGIGASALFLSVLASARMIETGKT